MLNFHAHCYFRPEQLPLARALAELARSCGAFDACTFHERPAGPHPLPAVEIHFREPRGAEARAWLEAHRGPLSVLIHPDTGDDIRDHSEGIQWLGDPLALDFGFFERILRHPELRVHPL